MSFERWDMTEARNTQIGARIHAIVLTRDRPETLRRCIATALSSLGPNDVLTILDDSSPAGPRTDASLLAMASIGPAPIRIYVSTVFAIEMITRSVSSSAQLWLSKTAPRDIAPLRNLSLLLSVAVPAQTTVFIDDDIHGFNLAETHLKVSALVQSGGGVVAGAHIGGINEMDTITRLSEAIDMIEDLPPGMEPQSVRDLFHTRGSSHTGGGGVARYLSAGYLAFRLPSERLFAFPPGYNEDWLWCLLHAEYPKVRILCLDEAVIHDPPSVRRPTREDCLFELVGDLIFDSLEDRRGENNLPPEAALTDLSKRIPYPASMPSSRALELGEKARSSIEKGCRLSAIEEFGITVLADMLKASELDMDGSQVLTGWCGDAIMKQRSFAGILRDNNAMSVLQSLMQEGRL